MVKNFSKFRSVVSTTVGAVVGSAKAIGNGFKAIWDGAVKWVGKAWTFISEIPGKIKSAFSGIWSGLANGLKSAINNILRLPLEIPRIDTHIPGVGKVGGQTLIPALKDGGIVNSATLALIGEGRESEAITPISKLTGMIDESLRSVLRSVDTSSDSSGPAVEMNIQASPGMDEVLIGTVAARQLMFKLSS